MLHDNHIRLLWHLTRFGLLDYPSCLELLATPELTDPVALSYAFRPLAKNKYLIKHKDGGGAVLAKGRALFPGLSPLIATGGGEQERRRDRRTEPARGAGRGLASELTQALFSRRQPHVVHCSGFTGRRVLAAAPRSVRTNRRN